MVYFPRLWWTEQKSVTQEDLMLPCSGMVALWEPFPCLQKSLDLGLLFLLMHNDTFQKVETTSCDFWDFCLGLLQTCISCGNSVLNSVVTFLVHLFLCVSLWGFCFKQCFGWRLQISQSSITYTAHWSLVMVLSAFPRSSCPLLCPLSDPCCPLPNLVCCSVWETISVSCIPHYICLLLWNK